MLMNSKNEKFEHTAHFHLISLRPFLDMVTMNVGCARSLHTKLVVQKEITSGQGSNR